MTLQVDAGGMSRIDGKIGNVNIEELVISQAGQRFKANDFLNLLKPGVYVCLKNERPLYVGMGNRLLFSVSRKNSHWKRELAFEQCDTILLYPCKSLFAAKELEKLLIEELKPQQNVHLKRSKEARLLGVKSHRISNTYAEQHQG